MDHISGWFPYLGAAVAIFLIWKLVAYVLKKRTVVVVTPVATTTTPASAPTTEPVPVPTSTPPPESRVIVIQRGVPLVGPACLLLALLVVLVILQARGELPDLGRHYTPPQSVASNGGRSAGSGVPNRIVVKDVAMLPPLYPDASSWEEYGPDDELVSPMLRDGGAFIARCSTSQDKPSESDYGRQITEAWSCPGHHWVRVSTSISMGIPGDTRLVIQH